MQDVIFRGPLFGIVSWLVTPTERSSLIRTYKITEAFIKATTLDLSTLQKAYEYYTKGLERQKFLTPKESTSLIDNAKRVEDPDVVRAALFRHNCQVVRILSGIGVCSYICCCECAAAYAGIACNREITTSTAGSWKSVIEAPKVLSDVLSDISKKGPKN